MTATSEATTPDVLRAHAADAYASELAALVAADDRPRPPQARAKHSPAPRARLPSLPHHDTQLLLDVAGHLQPGKLRARHRHALLHPDHQPPGDQIG